MSTPQTPTPDRLPRHAEPPRPGQVSVWSFPRPATWERSSRLVEVRFAGETVARSTRAIRTLETSHPPSWYIPPEDVRMDLLAPTARRTMCEWKGAARYYDLAVGDLAVGDLAVGGARSAEAAWSYPAPTGPFAALANHVAFYPGRVEACFVDGERVAPQAGGFYGGWITADLAGPFKGAPGTMGW